MIEHFKDKVAVVTGGAGGIGRGICLLMAEEGAKVVVNDLGCDVHGIGSSTDPADRVVQEIREKGGTAIASYDDVSTTAGGENIVKAAVDNFGRLDILVTAHGILRDRMIFNMTEEEWDRVIAVHLKGTFTCVRFASPVMRQQKGGRVVTFTSNVGLYGNSGQANYAAAKDGIAAFTRVVARDLGRYGVTVNSIAPMANTRMTDTIPEHIRQRRESQRSSSFLQLSRDPLDIAPLVAYLATDEASSINGQIFSIGGGIVSLMGHPERARTIHKEGRWSYEEIAAVFPLTLGEELRNPAPPLPPQ